MKTFSNRSNAIRSLKKIGEFTKEQIDALLIKSSDGVGFDEEAAKAVLRSADEAAQKANEEEARAQAELAEMARKQAEDEAARKAAAARATGYKSTVVRDGKAAAEKSATKPVKNEGSDTHSKDCCPLCGGEAGNQTWFNEDITCQCHECGKVYSYKTRREVRVGHSRGAVPSGYSIEKDRPEQNGVKRPSSGTLCGQVWQCFDDMVAMQTPPTSKDLTEIAETNGWNKNNVVCEFYNWRKFKGIRGRQS